MSGHIKIVISMGTRYESMVAEGICQALKSRSSWIVRQRQPGTDWLKCIKDWNADAAIIGTPEPPDKFAKIKIPTVILSALYENHNHPSVIPDDIAVGRMGAEYLLNLNLKNFALWRKEHRPCTRRRWEGFAETLKAAGVPEKNIHTCPKYNDMDKAQFVSMRHNVNRDLRKWLISLPKPIGLIVVGGEWEYYFNDLARDCGIDIPNEIALLGVGNDELLCELTRPPLSSISLATGRIGYEAVRIIDEMLAGKPAPSQPMLVSPAGVVSRGSTDMLAVDDPDMIRAIKYIRTHATEDICVNDLLKTIPVSRSSLDNKFKQYFNRTLGAEIRRLRLEKVCYLLTHTDLNMPEIARRCGFNSSEYMATFFLREKGMSPSAHRRKMTGR